MRMASIIGHRGAAGLAPENTLAGLYKAHELKLGWVEIDAALLADQTVVVFHDEKIDRCTPETGYLRDLEWGDVTLLDVGSWFENGKYPYETMPLLPHYLGFAKKLGIGVNVELKTHGDEGVDLGQVAGRRIQFNAHGNILISSFDLDALSAFSADFPKAILYDQLPSDWMKAASELRAECIHLDARFVEQDEIKEIKASTRDVYVYTVNDYETAKKLWDWGVDGVFSDFPNRLNEFYKPEDPSSSGT